ncbi:MAG TPA: diguanylate cyclase [Coriobacteriia bacterium]
MGTGPLIVSRKSGCRECWGCVRACPARAIRVVDGVSEAIPEKCVRCGLCVSECGNDGYTIRDDTDDVRALLASERPVVAVLATEFVAALYPMSPREVESAVEHLGFYAVESTLLGEESVAMAYEDRHVSSTGVPIIRSTCPVVNDWVCKYHEALASALVPVLPPYVAQARLIKAVYPKGTAVVYVSPCYARKDEWRDPEFAGALDAVIDFTELGRMLGGDAGESAARADSGSKRPEPLKELSLTDGYPRATMVSHDLTTSDVIVVRGLKELDRLLVAIESGEAAPLIIDALNCEGCVDGPAVNPGMSVFAKRNVDWMEREARMRSAVSSRELLRHLPTIDMVRRFRSAPVHAPMPSAAEIGAILAEAGFLDPDHTLDCGACGYATCREQAIAIYQGNSSWDLCFPFQRRELSRSVVALEESSTLDSLTALWNRRVFSERLTEEIARHTRYGTPVSLLMLDLDGFKAINDAHGHVAGDSVLVAVADLLRASLRTTDLPTRYGGDEFAIILPGVHKTDAFAVAEKVRAGIAALEIPTGRNDDAVVLTATASLGVAAAQRGQSDPVELVEAADHALYQAKESGKDQVRLAPG